MRPGARVVAKASPGERVGVFARRAGRLEVVEYSELDPGEAASVDPRAGPGGGPYLSLPNQRQSKEILHSCWGTWTLHELSVFSQGREGMHRVVGLYASV